MTPDLPTGRHSPSDRSAHHAGVVVPRGFVHVRLTVTDIHPDDINLELTARLTGP